MVAPARERGLKYNVTISTLKKCGRSREGAWIEIDDMLHHHRGIEVAPARERGLKSVGVVFIKIHAVSLPRGSVD